MKFLFLLIIISISLSGCRDNESLHYQLDQIESIMDTHPEKALKLLEAIPLDSLSKYDIARFGVLSAQARNKNYLPLFQGDSLLDISLDYFKSHADKVYFAKALFYKNRIFQEMTEWKEATASCHQAISLLSDTKEYKLLCMLYGDLGIIFNQQSLYTEAISSRQKGYEYAILCNDSSLQGLMLSDIGKSLIFQNKLTSSLVYLQKALELAITIRDSSYIFMYFNNLSMVYRELEQYEKATKLLDASASYLSQLSDQQLYYLNKGDILLLTQQYDSAYYYLNLAKNRNDLYSQASCRYSLYILEKTAKNYEKANTYLEQYLDIADSINQTERTQDMKTLVHKHTYEMNVHKMKTEYQNRMVIYISISLVVFLIILLSLQNQNKKKKVKILLQQQRLDKVKDDLEHLNTQIKNKEIAIATLKTFEQQANENIASYISQINSREEELLLLHNREVELQKQLFSQSPVYKTITALEGQDINKKNEMKVLSTKDRQELSRTIEEIFKQFILKLNIDYPSLTEEDILFCCLSRLDFSMQLIALCFGVTDTNSMRQRKYRIKNKLLETTDISVLGYIMGNDSKM